MLQGRNANREKGKRKILVVEDNELNREMLEAILEDEYDIIQAENGKVGLEKLEEHHEDLSLVLLDVYMPVMTGLEFLEHKLHDERYDTVPVIVATASSTEDDEVACLELGANDFVVKPYNFEIMRNRIGNIIRLRESASLVNQLTWDDVTGYYSKDFFYSEMESALAARPEGGFDVVCSDIENFPALIDRYGQANCNVILSQLADRLAELMPDLVGAGRIAEDTFAFVIDHQDQPWTDVLYSVADNLTFKNVNVKFGLVQSMDRTMTVQSACNRALSAIEAVKGRHGIEVGLFDDELYNRQMLEQTIRDSMEQALADLQFSVFYQPKFDVRANKVGGAEALVRWFHPEIGFVSPGLFIPIFERNGFITKLDMFVWEEACRQIKRLEAMGLPVVPISVNASRLDFDVPDLPEQIAELADRTGVDRSLLHVELTETAYSDNPEAVIDMLRRLKDLGFSTELDDFGAGYSSLASLNTLPLDVMKLDMSMVRQATELNDFRIVESTIKLAQLLGLKTVVEGVETAEEAQKVTEMGCDLIQGFYFSKPLNREDFEAYLQQ